MEDTINITITDYRARMRGCWLGKNIGGILGTPTEGSPFIHSLEYYEPVPDKPLPNDDVELQMMYLAKLAGEESPVVNRLVLADIWRNHFGMHCDEYAVALRNLKMGLLPPWTGSFDNAFTEGMGAAIRSELWACLAPNNPALAAKWAYEDACIDHAGLGIDAEVFLAALESLAFGGGEIRSLIGQAMDFLPQNSEFRVSLADAITMYDDCRDWRSVRESLVKRYGVECPTSVRMNIPLAVLALLEGNGDFGRTICTAVNCGMDTDCTGATTGAIMGILHPDGIGQKWLAPIGEGIAVRPEFVKSLDTPKNVDDLCGMIEALRAKLPVDFMPVPDTPSPDLAKFNRNVDVAFVQDKAWFLVETSKLEWKTIQARPSLGELPLDKPNDGNYFVVLRFRFDVPQDGEYEVMFNSDSSNQCYLDPPRTLIHDAKDMTFGRIRLWMETPDENGNYPALPRPLIWEPSLACAPLNQIKRCLKLKAGEHQLLVVLEPLPCETRIRWGFGVGTMDDNAFVI